jgi:hypothetical protein
MDRVSSSINEILNIKNPIESVVPCHINFCVGMTHVGKDCAGLHSLHV